MALSTGLSLVSTATRRWCAWLQMCLPRQPWKRNQRKQWCSQRRPTLCCNLDHARFWVLWSMTFQWFCKVLWFDRRNGKWFVEMNVQRILENLLSVKTAPLGTLVNLQERQIVHLCHEVRIVLMQQSMLAQVESPVNICGWTFANLCIPLKWYLGDTHGQYYDLLKLLDVGGPPPDSS